MEFAGPFTGALILMAPRAFCDQTAANVLGLEADEPEAQRGAEDALKELLNIACGNLLTTLAGEEPVFDLSIPKVEAISGDEWKAVATSPATAGFVVDDWVVYLRLTLSHDAERGE
jgi:chemotaxis protein CheY-P-specific phosphatase CheC